MGKPTVVICGPQEPTTRPIERIQHRRQSNLKRAAHIIATTANVASELIHSGIDSVVSPLYPVPEHPILSIATEMNRSKKY